MQDITPTTHLKATVLEWQKVIEPAFSIHECKFRIDGKSYDVYQDVYLSFSEYKKDFLLYCVESRFKKEIVKTY